MQIQLKCHRCSNSNANYAPTRPEFVAVGYHENIAWSEFHRRIPATDRHNNWPRSDRPPNIGEKRIILAQHPFCEDMEQEFWILYVPALASLNGWDEYPAEIARSAFLQCRIMKVLKQTATEALLKVKVTDRLDLDAATERIPAQLETACILDTTLGNDGCQRIRYGQWQYCWGNTQSDVGHWMILQTVQATTHLVAYGEWSFHQDVAYLGNLVLSATTNQRLADRYALHTG